jgi:Fur family transcriptional regulator, zinc uptake regulator
LACANTDPMQNRLTRAAEACAREGARLTDIRRRVLALVLAAREPVGAYALLDRLKAEKANATPATIYRALDFLQQHTLIHKVERLNAFIGCTEEGEHLHRHDVQFLICRRCGTVAELEDDGIAAAVAAAAAGTGFRPARATVEVEGLCAACAARPGSLPLDAAELI